MLIQGTPGATVMGIARSAPSIGLRGLYRGIIPAAGGARRVLGLWEPDASEICVTAVAELCMRRYAAARVDGIKLSG